MRARFNGRMNDDEGKVIAPHLLWRKWYHFGIRSTGKKKKKIKIFTALKHNKPDLSAFQLQSVRNNPTEVSLNET